MNNLKLTPSELSLLHNLASENSGKGARVGFYASVMAPAILFGGYGVANRDVLAIAMALVGLLLFMAWRISRELTLLPIYKALFTKVLELERLSSEQSN